VRLARAFNHLKVTEIVLQHNQHINIRIGPGIASGLRAVQVDGLNPFAKHPVKLGPQLLK
jgi:hypothetical protein